MNKERCRCGDEKGAGVCMLDCSAAEGEDQRVASRKADDSLMFTKAECWLAVTGKEFGDGDAGFRFNYVIHINEFPAETCGEQRADRAFAGAHEAGEDDAARRGRCGLDLRGHSFSTGVRFPTLAAKTGTRRGRGTVEIVLLSI